MTRCMYAQLSQQRFTPPKVFEPHMPPSYHPDAAAAEVCDQPQRVDIPRASVRFLLLLRTDWDETGSWTTDVGGACKNR